MQYKQIMLLLSPVENSIIFTSALSTSSLPILPFATSNGTAACVRSVGFGPWFDWKVPLLSNGSAFHFFVPSPPPPSTVTITSIMLDPQHIEINDSLFLLFSGFRLDPPVKLVMELHTATRFCSRSCFPPFTTLLMPLIKDNKVI